MSLRKRRLQGKSLRGCKCWRCPKDSRAGQGLRASACEVIHLIGTTGRTDNVAVGNTSRVERWRLVSHVRLPMAVLILHSSLYVPDCRVTTTAGTQRPRAAVPATGARKGTRRKRTLCPCQEGLVILLHSLHHSILLHIPFPS